VDSLDRVNLRIHQRAEAIFRSGRPENAVELARDLRRSRCEPGRRAVSIWVALNHRTTYSYDRDVALGPQIVRLRPAPHCRTPILSYSVKVTPAKHFINWQQDPQGNYLARLVFPEKTRRFEVAIDLVADMAVINPFDFFLEPSCETFPFEYDPALTEDLAPFRKVGPPGPLLAAWLAKVDRAPARTVDFIVGLNRRLQQDIAYIVRMEPGVQGFEETLSLRKGSCRDTGWLLVNILRHLGFAARFVSGYLIQLVADEKALDGPSGPESDFTDLHAWCEVYLPGAGWIGFDPTSGLMAGEGHIPLACTPEPQSAAPVEGLIEKAEVTFEVAMSVTRVRETPRTTRPYAEAEWRRILASGDAIDRELTASDMHLTMGGEPTFVSIDDMDGEEWNTAALGATKRRLAGYLFRRLSRRFAKGPLLHHGQGKWYPGEQLPRWALTCLWRKDGQPVWRDQGLFALEEQPIRANQELASQFGRSLAERLQLDPSYLLPAFEDTWYYLWRERRLPVNVDPADSRLDEPMERARLARVFEQGLESVAGHVLPIKREGGRWRSGPLFVRPEKLYLIPGDSPIGYRLPLDSLPWVAPGDREGHVEPDPMAPLQALPNPSALRHPPLLQARAAPKPANGSGRVKRPSAGESAKWLVRTAIAIEPRDGHLHVFMPPTETAEDYLELIAAVEDTAAELGTPLFIEGYTPPYDPRLVHFSVTPDPGVIEVNIHPSDSWPELAEKTEIIYEEARNTRLGAQKFMLDGRHTGTGGGNHITIGGSTPSESPLLRRPDVLKSLLGYWHNHPSLSYLFSGLFIGPTSQHPRVDEARNDALFELEIAFKQIRSGEETAPWLVDRIFRNLLVDVTGNTHRAEFCIDKLYSPDSAGGRRGLLELRAFEMPPHPRMSMAQQLLLRGILAMVWRTPYERPLTRWGTRLHDDFMLPHFVWQDLGEVVADLRQSGYDIDQDWFSAHQEFRFPEIGHVAHRGMELELRHALEPWHVLGEDASGGGTARYVDSSLERLQVKLTGMNDTRHVVSCNGFTVPLRATGVPGEYVAGVRYRAWAPPNALHPTIGIHAPLVFDLYDGWNGRSLGGCTYHVVHPGGRSYDRFPVNANEAEARRRVRFAPIGHSQGSTDPPRRLDNPDHPLTLDLRRL